MKVLITPPNIGLGYVIEATDKNGNITYPTDKMSDSVTDRLEESIIYSACDVPHVGLKGNSYDFIDKELVCKYVRITYETISEEELIREYERDE